DNEDLSHEVQPYLEKLEQEGRLVCPESIEDPPEEVDGLILYQTEEEQSMDSSLDAETFIRNETGEFSQSCGVGFAVHSRERADQVNEISEGQLDCVSLGDAEPGCDEIVEKMVNQEAKTSLMELGETESELAEPCSPSGSALESARARDGAQAEISVDQNLNSRNCRSDASSFSLDQENKDDLLDQNEMKTNLALNVNDIDTKSSDLKFSIQQISEEKKPLQFMVPIKVEVTKAEETEDVCPDSSEIKHAHFISFHIKSEGSETKAEQLEYPLRAPFLDVKPEDLSLSMKSENFDVKPETFQFVAYSDGSKIKPEVKPDLRFTVYPDGGRFKTEIKPEGLGLAGFPDTIKPEAKPDALEFTTFPNSSGIKPEIKPEALEFTGLPDVKAEMKREMLEADSTVLTPKLEQIEGTVDTSESLLKGQVKEERPSTPAPASMCEIPDSLHESREPTIAQLLQEKALYSFSEWPKDRVIINRLDSICHAILKGKWPSSSEQYDSLGSLAANSCLANSLAQHRHHRTGFLPTTASGTIPGQPRVQQASSGLGFPVPPPLTRLPKERLVAPPFLPELKRAGGRRSFDYEAAAAAAAAKILAGKSASPSHTSTTATSSSTEEKVPVVAPPSHRTGAMLNGWQEAAIDLTKSTADISPTSSVGTNEAAGISHHNARAGSSHKLPPLPPITAPLPGSVGIDMSGILQAGLIHPVTGQIVNGSLRGDDSLRRRRGRRRNVEALYSEFAKSRGLHLPETQVGGRRRGSASEQARVEAISHSSVSSSTSSPSPSPSERPAGPPTPSSSSTPTPTQTPPQPEIVAIDREAASKGLIEWLRQNPGYSMDLPAFAHRRHRCKDPTKLDINTLTGEERVPVVHRGTGRRLGGAMAPAIKELSRWLDANSEYFVAPDWAEGFLPEGKFSRILTEPVNRDPGSRRRGRRPRSEMPKPLLSVSDSSSTGLGPPLYMNGGLIGSMDSIVTLQNLRGAIPGIPISGIMAAGFPHGFPAAVSAGSAGSSAEDAKNGLSMLPMMLHGIPHPHSAAIPHHALFSVGTMMAHAPPPPHPSSSSASPSSSASASAVNVTTTTAASEEASPSSTTTADRESISCSAPGGDKEKAATDGAKRPTAGEAAAVITSTSRVHLGAAGNHHTFNPFLIPGMSHGLLYPHMFLPHGSIMTLPAVPPGGGADGSPGSPKRRRKRVREDEEREKGKVAAGGEEERESTVTASAGSQPAASSIVPFVLASELGTAPTEGNQVGWGTAEDGPSECQEPDSNNHNEKAAAEEKEEGSEETGDEVDKKNSRVVERVGYDYNRYEVKFSSQIHNLFRFTTAVRKQVVWKKRREIKFIVTGKG
ncbi:hypothetical protein GOODEAATRI_007623, partial [Goodea atripinnis]